MADNASLECFEEAGANTNYGLRIGAIFAILGLSILGGYLPLVLKTKEIGMKLLRHHCYQNTRFIQGVYLKVGSWITVHL